MWNLPYLNMNFFFKFDVKSRLVYEKMYYGYIISFCLLTFSTSRGKVRLEFVDTFIF